MKNMWRVMVLALCVVMVCGLAGCGSDTPVESSEPPGEDSTAPAAQGSGGEVVNITYSCWGTIEENAATQSTIDSFNASQDKIAVELMLIPWESYVQQLNTMAAAGNLPDSANLKEEMVICCHPLCGILFPV